MNNSQLTIRTAASALGLLGVVTIPAGATEEETRDVELVSQSAMLAGLPAQTVFPFIDVTPSNIRRAHIAVTDSTSSCAGPGSGVPNRVQILVGKAGGKLVPVLTQAANTGISINPKQCVFHVTVRAGADGIPDKVTDIVVVNAGDSRLTGFNTITVSAEVVLRTGGADAH